jgi:hypothetical protein
MPVTGDIYNPWRMFNGCFIPNAVLRCRDLSARAKLVFGRLCQYAGENGEAYPTYRTLAREVGVERRQAMRAIQELEAFGLVRAVGQRREDGSSRSNTYVFLWHEIFQGASAHSPPGVTNDTQGGAEADTPARCRKCHPGVSSLTPKEIQTKEAAIEETTTIRLLLAGTPLDVVADRELLALARRHGQELLELAADVAAETWRRDRGEIGNPGGYLHSLCSSLVLPGWYEPAAERQAKAMAIREKKRAAQQAQQKNKEETDQQARQREDYWRSLTTVERNRFMTLVTSAYPNLQLPAIAITATAKTLAWEQQTTL